MEPLVAVVAYGSADGFEFARSLVEWLDDCELPVTAWFDHDNPQDAPFEQRIENAIIGCQVVLLVLTDAAVADGSWARRECIMANELDTTIIAVRPEFSSAQLPLCAQGAAVIDMVESKGGWKRLAHELSLLHPTDDTVRRLTEQHRQLERLAKTRSGAERDALRRRAGALSAVIQQLQRRVDDAQGHAGQVHELIRRGQLADAANARPSPAVGPFRVIGAPPLISSTGLHDRHAERNMVQDFLSGTDVRLMTLCGPPGAGKTALVRFLLSQLPDTGYRGAVYLSTHGPGA
jgi:hypothetical protein